MVPPPGAPLWVLQPSTVSLLAVQLQQQKLIPSIDGHLRDWRGVAELSGFASNYNDFLKIKNSPEPFTELFNYWKKKPEANIKELWDILGKIDRYDVRDDAAEKMLVDIKIAAEAAAKKGLDLNKLNAAETPTGEEALTLEDLDCLNSGKPLPTYDAFVLYGKEDEHIISEIVTTLEAQGLKILIKDRDLLGGTFEHAAVMELISTRCTKLVPFFSNSFFSSEYNKFLANFAQHISLEKASRKIVPIVSEERCEIPPNLALYYKLKYQPNNPLFNFWEKLVKTINPDIKYNPQKTPKIVALPANQSKQPSPVPVKPASTPKSNTKLVRPSDFPSKQEFSNIAFNGNSSSEPSSLESETIGDSGALLLPEVPSHEPGGLVGWVKSKLPNKKGKKKVKTKYKQAGAASSAC